MILTGLARLGADAVVRFTPQNEAVANLSLAFNYGKKGSDGKRPTQWIDASLWGKRAEALEQYLVKGAAVDVVLSDPHIEEFEGRNGKGFKLVARVLDIELAGVSRDGQAAGSSAPASRPATASKPAPGSGGGGFNDFEDDIPFLPIGRGAAAYVI